MTLSNAEKLRLKRADVLESKKIGFETVKHLQGNVQFEKGDIKLNCQRSVYKERKDIAFLFNQVKIFKDDLILECDSITFYSKKNKLESNGNPIIYDLGYKLVADSLIYFTELDSGIALGNVELIQNDQKIKADRIEYVKNPGSEAISYIAIGNVEIIDSLRTATCGLANYNDITEKTILGREPIIIDEQRTIAGEQIVLQYDKKSLSRLLIPNNAKIFSSIMEFDNIEKDSSHTVFEKNDDMTSKRLDGFFINGSLDSLRLVGMASTTYHIFEDSLYKGKNITSGDTIMMKFYNKELNNIIVSGGAQGEYIPNTKADGSTFPLIYSADKLDYFLKDENTNLSGNAQARHDNTDLKAGFIKVNWKTRILKAFSRDWADSTSSYLKPSIIEKGRDPMVGNEMTYNLDTKRGKINYGKTKADDGFYRGSEIRNESNKTIYIKNSVFTTCDLDTPHFHFESEKMKIIQDDVVIAKPIVLKIAEIPVFGIPLAIFPHQGGKRHSGWIMPAYGESKSRGQYIDGLGFYWAPNDYWDSKFTLSFGDRQGAVLNVKNQYRLRYKYSGSLFIRNQQFLSGSKDIINLKENRNSNFTVRWNHVQKLRNNQNFNANTTYSSNGSYNRNYGLNLAQRMDQKATSNVTYSKRWPKSKNSVSLNLYSNQDLLVDKKVDNSSNYYVSPTQSGSQLNISNRTLPKISFRHGQSSLFPTSANIKKWYNTIMWNYGFNYTKKERKYYKSTFSDSLNSFDWAKDSFGNPVDTLSQDDGWTHTASLNAPMKLFKNININPNINFRSSWVNRTFDKIWIDSLSSFQTVEKNGFNTRTTGAVSINANTKLYGLFAVPFGPLKVIRHVASPSIGFSWSPDFSKPLFGYDFGYIKDYNNPVNNEKIKHDRFAGTMAGNTPMSEQKNINFSLNNIFQAKTIIKEEEKKIDLFSLRMSSSYNFSAENYKLSNLRSSLRSKILGKLNLDLSTTHDFYGFDTKTGSRVENFNKNERGIIAPRLTSARISTGFRLKGKALNNQSDTKLTAKDSIAIQDDLDGPGLQNPITSFKNTLTNESIWSTNISISYNYNAFNPLNSNKTLWVNSSSNIKLSKNWKIAYRARFDMVERDLVSHNVSVNRDLHCWELSLNWTPGGIGQGVYFKLNVKSPTLKDLKLEKKGGVYSSSPF
ncbi:hypothetical protein HOI27_07685 [bacterium]|nr:hypothetical protein [bacterium]